MALFPHDPRLRAFKDTSEVEPSLKSPYSKTILSPNWIIMNAQVIQIYHKGIKRKIYGSVVK